MNKEAKNKIRDILRRFGDFMDGNAMHDDVLDIDEALTKIEIIFTELFELMKREIKRLSDSAEFATDTVEYSIEELEKSKKRIIKLKQFIADNEIVLKSANSDVKRMTKYVNKLEQERAEVEQEIIETIRLLRTIRGLLKRLGVFAEISQIVDNLLAKLGKVEVNQVK